MHPFWSCTPCSCTPFGRAPLGRAPLGRSLPWNELDRLQDELIGVKSSSQDDKETITALSRKVVLSGQLVLGRVRHGAVVYASVVQVDMARIRSEEHGAERDALRHEASQLISFWKRAPTGAARMPQHAWACPCPCLAVPCSTLAHCASISFTVCHPPLAMPVPWARSREN